LEEKKMLLPKRDSIFKEHREDLYESIRITETQKKENKNKNRQLDNGLKSKLKHILGLMSTEILFF